MGSALVGLPAFIEIDDISHKSAWDGRQSAEVSLEYSIL